MSQIPENLKYTEEHEWVLIEENIATIGITDFAQNSLGDIVFVELPDEESDVEKGETFGVVESIKSVSDLYSPIDGVVTEKNSNVEDSPESINEDAYEGWLIKVDMKNPSQVESLMSAEKYKEFCESNS
jgi:glycine cleavage system H protein